MRVCAYEFTYRPVLIALANAITRGVDVAIVYHGVTANETAVGQAGLPKTNKGKKILFTRTKTEIPHNKFIVKLNKQGAPIELWTGSTNFTSSGFLGQTNVGHLVVDSKTAETYLKFWERLSTDPDPDQAKANAISLTKNPANTIPAKPISIVFSPRPSSKMLAWYSQRIADAASSVMFTGAFGVDATILAGIARPNPGMRFVLLEKPPSKEIKAAVKANPGQVVVSFGAVLSKETGHDTEGKPTKKLVPIPHSELDKWFLSEELERRSGDGFVFFIHTKFLLVDPLSDDPLVCSGSANFSRNSLTANDENMLLIRGDKRVADIYFTEFDRIFRHFYFRDVANDLAHDTKSDDDAIFLKEDGSWTAGYFKPGSSKTRRRELFFANSKNTWVAKAKADPDPFKGEAVAKGAKAASGKKSKPPAKKPKGKPS